MTKLAAQTDMGINSKQPISAFTSKDGIFYKSSYSGGGGCVAVAWGADGQVLVADTKNPSLAPHSYSPEEWRIFIDGIKDGQFDSVPGEV